MNPGNDKQWLEQKYLKEGLSTVAIGKLAGVYPSTVNRWLRQFKIPLRAPKRRGEWKPGSLASRYFEQTAE